MINTIDARSIVTVNELRLSQLPLHHNNYDSGEIVVVEGNIDVPFALKRIFTLRVPVGTMRSGHAHRCCTQFMICPHGMVEINCDDGREQKSFLLNRGHLGLLVRPGIWTTQKFLHENSLLLVACDQLYQESDYIRDYASFLAWEKHQ